MYRLNQQLENSSYISIPFFSFNLIVAIIYVWKNRLSLKMMGISRKYLIKSVLEAALATIFILTLSTLLKWLFLFKPFSIVLFKEAIGTSALRELFPMTLVKQVDTWTMISWVAMYALFVPVQEFIIRGVLLGRLLHFAPNRYNKWVAIAVTSFIYALMHAYMGWQIVMMVFIPGFICSVLFARSGNLIGVVLSHLAVGLYAAFILELIN